MSDDVATEATESAGDTSTTGDFAKRIAELEADRDKWKAHSRKNEDKAKANADAAKRLADIEQANMTEAEKLQARIAELQSQHEEALTAAAASSVELWRERSARKYGITDDDLLSLITGETEDEVQAKAKILGEKLAKASEPDRAIDLSAGSSGAAMALNGDPLLAHMKAALNIT